MSRTYRTLLVAVVAILAVGGYWKFALAPKRQRRLPSSSSRRSGGPRRSSARRCATIATYQDAKGAYKTNRATVVRLGKAVADR